MNDLVATSNEEKGLLVYDQEQIDLIKRTVAVGTTNEELQMFLHICKRTRLDPFARQIYAVKRYDSKSGKEVMQTQISIDGARLVAERSGKYRGQIGPEWCGKDGVWKDVWLSEEAPTASRVGVIRSDFDKPLWTVALWSNYVQVGKNGVTHMWKKMGPLMIAKCAEMLALRKSFPFELSNLYSNEEMSQIDNIEQPRSSPQRDAQESKNLVLNNEDKPFDRATAIQELEDALIKTRGPNAITKTVKDWIMAQPTNRLIQELEVQNELIKKGG